MVVQEHGIDSVSKREVHGRRDEDIIPSIRIDVSDARSPRPVVLYPHGVGNFFKRTFSRIVIHRIAEHETGGRTHEEAVGGMRRSLFCSSSGPTFSVMSECISVTNKSRRPSL